MEEGQFKVQFLKRKQIALSTTKVESLEQRILQIPLSAPMGKAGISKELGQKKPHGQLHAMINQLLLAGKIVRANPNSRLQKYKLSGKGRKALK